MAREFQRADRVADAIQRSIANIIQNEIRDPRVGMVNINSVTVTRDLAYSKLYVTFVGVNDQAKCEAAVSVLNNAAAYMRTLLSKDVKMRTTPRLQFYYDRSSVRGQELSALIDKAVAADSLHHPESESDSEEG